MKSKNQYVSVYLPAEHQEFVRRAVSQSGMSQSEFYRQALLSAARTVLEPDSDERRNSPVAGAELVITERGQGQMVRDIMVMKIMLTRLYGELAATKLGGLDAAREDKVKIESVVDNLINEHGLVFE